jgi:hypothetical protein
MIVAIFFTYLSYAVIDKIYGDTITDMLYPLDLSRYHLEYSTSLSHSNVKLYGYAT